MIVTVPTNLIADEAIRFSPALPDKVDAARGLPLGLADKVVLALDDAASLPKDGNLRGATMRTGWAPIICARSVSPASKAFSAAATQENWKMPAKARSAAASIDEIVSFLGNDYRRKLTPLRGIALGARSVCARILFARPARPCRQAHGARRAGRRPPVLRRRSDLAELFLHRARRARQRRAGGEGGVGAVATSSQPLTRTAATAARSNPGPSRKRRTGLLRGRLSSAAHSRDPTRNARILTPSPAPAPPGPARSRCRTCRRSDTDCGR